MTRIFCLPGQAEPQKVNPHGIYDIRLCINGQWRYIRLDDYFPCKFNGDTIYARAHGPELWVLLLEKAFAKAMGSYDALRMGWAYEALMDLTGAPTTKIFFDDGCLLYLISQFSVIVEFRSNKGTDCKWGI